MKKKRRTVPDDVRVYTVQEVMIILGISSRTAYKLVKSGAFHTVHVGGHYRIVSGTGKEVQDDEKEKYGCIGNGAYPWHQKD